MQEETHAAIDVSTLMRLIKPIGVSHINLSGSYNQRTCYVDARIAYRAEKRSASSLWLVDESLIYEVTCAPEGPY